MAIQRKRRYVKVNCDMEDVDGHLDHFSVDYDLASHSAYQVGIGFGSKVNVLLIFRLREETKEKGYSPNGHSLQVAKG